MKKILFLTMWMTSLAFASLNVDTTYATFGAITKKIAGYLANVRVLASSKYDPHFIVPKPSLLSKLHRADLLIINGAGLELGWLPPLIKSANNPNIQVGAKGFLDMSHFISLIDVPTSVSRAFGDVHAAGNPHYFTDPHTVLDMAKAIAQKLEELDSQHANNYQTNLDKFLKEWRAYLKVYDANMATCRDKKVVQYHELYNYFLKRYGYTSYGNIEPLPGIAPSSKHTIELINIMKKNAVKTILQDVYHEKKSAKFIASKTAAVVEIIPHDVAAVAGSDSLEDFYNTIAKRICK